MSRKVVKPGNEGISSFEALCTAIASCVGSGNIIGVSTAILAGGLGAIFWMWVAAFLGMATKYGEIILGMLYREKNDKGEYVGGSMYYIEKGLGTKWLATLSAFLLVTQIIGGNFIQSNAISGVVANNFGIAPLSTGIVLMVCIFITTIGGLKRLAGIAQKLVPFMAGLYILAGVIIIIIRIDQVPFVLSEIFYGAFEIGRAHV